MAPWIGFLGGTGIEGRALALRFASAHVPVILGSRVRERAEAAADACNRKLGGGGVEGVENLELLRRCELVFLTVPFDQATPLLEALRSDLVPGSILVDVTVPITIRAGRAELVAVPAGSSSEMLAPLLPREVALVGAFKTIPAHVLGDLETDLDCDVFVCGDGPAAKQRLMDTIRLVPGLRPLDAGPLRAARILEAMTLLAIDLNRRYRRRGARFRLQGLDA